MVNLHTLNSGLFTASLPNRSQSSMHMQVQQVFSHILSEICTLKDLTILIVRVCCSLSQEDCVLLCIIIPLCQEVRLMQSCCSYFLSKVPSQMLWLPQITSKQMVHYKDNVFQLLQFKNAPLTKTKKTFIHLKKILYFVNFFFLLLQIYIWSRNTLIISPLILPVMLSHILLPVTTFYFAYCYALGCQHGRGRWLG